jgi:xanthine dehydrogenase YagR molybdenum-binding subunit
MNNSVHRPATVQGIRIGATQGGKITAIAHESWLGNLPGGRPETAVEQTKLLYAGANRLTAMRLAVLDLPEGNSMRTPGEAPGMMALEAAMDEMAEKLGIDPGIVTVETDMTDIGTGSYNIIVQTAEEMMGIGIDKVVVRLGDSAFPVSAGSGGQ